MMLSSSWCTIFLVPLLRLITAAPTNGIDVMVVDPQQTGCLYDNKLFSENQVIPTKEPCLICSCKQEKISCRLQVCPYIDEGSLYPPPAGCILVERKGACCPKLHCPTASPGGNRLLRKDPTGQITAWKARDDLRKRLVKQLTKNGTEKIGCVEGGTLYAEGSAMMTSSTCEYCFCLKGKQNCVKPRCAVAKPMEGCTPRFQKELACCPTHYVCDNTTDLLKNSTTAFTKKIALVGNRHRPLLAVSKRMPQTGIYRMVDSSKNNEFKSQEIINHRDQKTVVKRATETNNKTSTIPLQNIDEVIMPTQGSESPIVSTPSSMIDTATAVDEKTPAVERTANDLNQDTTEPQGDHYTNSTTAKESSVADDSAPATSSETVMMTTSVDTTSFTETPTSKSDDKMLISSTTQHEEEEETSSTLPEDESTDSLINLTSQRRADDAEQQSDHDNENEEAEAAERAIEVSVSSSISSVSFSQAEHTNRTIGDTPGTSKNASPPSNFFPINSKVPTTPSGSVIPLVPAPVKNEDHEDYDYDNMELPPSLPNLEIIPFVAADAVHGVPSNFDDDERLSLGGLSTNQQLTSPLVPVNLEERNDTSDVSVEPTNTNIDESKAKTSPESESSLPSQTASPIQAFKVTFPPRSSSTLPPTSPSIFLNRFTLKRTTTQKTTVAPLPTRSKLNKPTVNNLIGSSSMGLTGGLRIDSCNIYGQMYRVGRIIDELSGPCIECKCTEIGVNCTNLKC